MKKDSFLYVIIFTFAATFVFVFLIALADNATADRVARNQELVSAQAFLSAVGKSEEDGGKALKAFEELFGEVRGEEPVETEIDGRKMLVKQFRGDGLWGTVTGVMAVDRDVSRFVGIDIISHSETPGLGGRIEEDWFKNQFRNEKIGPEGIRVRKGEGGADRDSENSRVDGVTGASLTSASMEQIVNNEIQAFRRYGK